MAKFKTLNRLLKRVGAKRKTDKEHLKRKTSFWKAIWRKRSTPVDNNDNGSPSGSRVGGSSLLRALSSLFRKHDSTKPSDIIDDRENELSPVATENGMVVEVSCNQPFTSQPSIEDDTSLSISESLSLTQSDHSLPSLKIDSSTMQQDIEEEHICPYCGHQGAQEASYLAQPEDWESSSEWLIFDVPEEPEPQMQLIKPKKRVTWAEDDEKCREIETRWPDKPPFTSDQAWKWIMAIVAIFLLLLFI